MKKDNEFMKRKLYLEKSKSTLENSCNNFSNLRFISFMAVLIFAFLLIKGSPNVLTIIGIVFTFLLFIYFLFKHILLSIKLKKINKLLGINEKYIKRIDGTFKDFEDTGDENTDIEHSYSRDLDLFGKNSLFQLINTTKTFFGRRKLTNLLKKPDFNKDIILKRQNAVKELSKKVAFCEQLELEGMDNEKTSSNTSKILQYIDEFDDKLFDSFKEKVVKFIPFVSGAVFICTFTFKFRFLYYALFLMLLIHLLVNIIGYLKVLPLLNSMEILGSSFSAYENILKLIEKEKFTDSYLIELQSNLFVGGKSSNALNRLDTIISLINLRTNFLLYFIFNLTVFWDIRCYISLKKWKDQYGDLIDKYINTAAEFEVLSSLAVIAHLDSNVCYPKISDSNNIIKADSIGHPLISSKTRIYNNIDFNNNIFIITGSNMSGKTTFLRTIGINLILAYIGAPVCAKSMDCSIFSIFTSMRINDNLSEGLSTFYVELTRIKSILDFLPNKKPTLFLIDEIFRGTNSEDRIIGAKTVLKELSKPWCCGLISTHDFELCDLENDYKNKIKNYHFKEDYLDNKIHFDYTLRSGRSDTTNARYLMKMIGINI